MTPPQPARVGPYEISGTLGAGGMGRVYKARDTRLDRAVAIKVPHERFSERTRREARALATLSHPHICQIYDVGELPDGADYLVMEYLEGDTLAARLTRGPLPVQQAVQIAMQIADALEAAHRRGIVHRDLKPSNIILTKSAIKLLDFGLVRMTSPASGGVETLTGVTGPGEILGTPQYMAPEQLEAREADARTDLFALGAVLYELVTGRRAFDAQSRARLVSVILSEEPPPVTTLQPTAPPMLQRIIEQCLAKDPDERWQSAHDLRLALSWVAPVPVRQQASRRVMWKRALGALAVLVVIAAVVWGFTRGRGGPQPQLNIRASLPPPANWYFEQGHFAVSPDGTRLAFVAVGAEGGFRLWIRPLAASGAHQVDGSDGAQFPFWAHDGKRVGFFARGKLKTVEAGGGAVRTVCDAPLARGGGAWSQDGTIVFAPSNSGPLYRVLDTGGTPAPATALPRSGSGQAHRWPVFLPDGKHFLYTASWSGPDDPHGDALFAASLAGGEAKLVSTDIKSNVGFSGGHLIFGVDRSLRAQPFDTARLQLMGTVFSILEQEVEYHPGFTRSAFSVSGNGVLAFQSLSDSASRLTWLDPAGKELARIQESGYSQPRISPDGRLVTVVADDAGNGKLFVRVYDLARGSSTRISDRGQEESPAWSLDGKRVIYSTFEGSVWSILEAPVDLSGPPQVFLKGAPMRHFDWSPDGHMVFADFSGGAPALKVYSSATRQVRGFGPNLAAEARFSPDGKWIAYTSFGGVFAEPFPGPGARVQVSTGLGTQPVWSRDGKRIYYMTPDRKLMSATFEPRTGTVGAAAQLAQTRVVVAGYGGTQYDVAPDGRILINAIPPGQSPPLTLLTGWLPR